MYGTRVLAEPSICPARAFSGTTWADATAVRRPEYRDDSTRAQTFCRRHTVTQRGLPQMRRRGAEELPATRRSGERERQANDETGRPARGILHRDRSAMGGDC